MPSVNESAPGTFSFPVRVYYEDTDTAGVVYYAGYLRFLERGRTEWLRALGVEQFRLAQEAGVVFAVRSLNIEYLRPARLDDTLAVLTELTTDPRKRVFDKGETNLVGRPEGGTLPGRAQVTLKQRIERDGETLVEATVRIACLNTKTMKPAALPAEIRRKMGAS